MPELTLYSPPSARSPRLDRVLAEGLAGIPYTLAVSPEELRPGTAILPAFSLPPDGLCPEIYPLLSALRRNTALLEDCVGGLIIDGPGELYTKSAGRDLALSMNLAGCALLGRPLVEAIGDLRNFTVQAANASCTLEEAYALAIRDTAQRLLSYAPAKTDRPRLTVLHASIRSTSNTLALWEETERRLQGRCDVQLLGLRNGTLEDCAGCPYTACLHFGEKGGCFYGGVMVQEVYPAIRSSDALVLLCPNYNDALSANLSACINRLTALYRSVSFQEKAVFGIVVSGYSGGDIVASQLVSALGMNKGFRLPPRFCLMETANRSGEALTLPGIGARLDAFAQRILTLCQE